MNDHFCPFERYLIIRPRSKYFDNAYRDRLIYFLREELHLSFDSIRDFLVCINGDWNVSSKAVSQAFYRYKTLEFPSLPS